MAIFYLIKRIYSILAE